MPTSDPEPTAFDPGAGLEAKLQAVFSRRERAGEAPPEVETLVSYLCGAMPPDEAHALERRLARQPAARHKLREIGLSLDALSERPLNALLALCKTQTEEARIVRAFVATVLPRASRDTLARAASLLRRVGGHQLRESAQAGNREARDAWQPLQVALATLTREGSSSSAIPTVALARGTADEEDAGAASTFGVEHVLKEHLAERILSGDQKVILFPRVPPMGGAMPLGARTRASIAVSAPIQTADTAMFSLAVTVPEELLRTFSGHRLRLSLHFSSTDSAEEAGVGASLTMGEWPLAVWERSDSRILSIDWPSDADLPAVFLMDASLLPPAPV